MHLPGSYILPNNDVDTYRHAVRYTSPLPLSQQGGEATALAMKREGGVLPRHMKEDPASSLLEGYFPFL